jgi:hypothetical protein
MKFPCYTTPKRKVEFVALKFSYAGSTFHSFRSTSRLVAASRSNAALTIEGPPSDDRYFLRVLIVQQRQWELMDVSTGPIYSLIYGGKQTASGSTIAMFHTIEDCPIVLNRNAIMNCGNIFFAAPLSDGDPGGQKALPFAMAAGDCAKITFLPSTIFMRFVGRDNMTTAKNGPMSL